MIQIGSLPGSFSEESLETGLGFLLRGKPELKTVLLVQFGRALFGSIAAVTCSGLNGSGEIKAVMIW